MSVAICSILAAKISTEQTSELGSHASYMKKLLSIVRTRMQENHLDITLKFTLSALWNLTDESPKTCKGKPSFYFTFIVSLLNTRDKVVNMKLIL